MTRQRNDIQSNKDAAMQIFVTKNISFTVSLTGLQ